LTSDTGNEAKQKSGGRTGSPKPLGSHEVGPCSADEGKVGTVQTQTKRLGALLEDSSMVINFLLWAVFGLIAGVVASFIGKRTGGTDPVGLITTALLGIAGAVVGGWLSSVLFNWDVNTFSITGFIVAVVGALLLLFLYRMFMSTRRTL
jgi:uncharacterized membrane protein YeaQ/YmgE (transglycosylase-associated protein family)